MLRLIETGLSREEAYKITQDNAMAAWNKIDGNFKANLLADERVTARLSKEQVLACFDPATYLKNLDHVYARVGVACGVKV